jgi:hypothetical protein
MELGYSFTSLWGGGLSGCRQGQSGGAKGHDSETEETCGQFRASRRRERESVARSMDRVSSGAVRGAKGHDSETEDTCKSFRVSRRRERESVAESMDEGQSGVAKSHDSETCGQSHSGGRDDANLNPESVAMEDRASSEAVRGAKR